MEKHLGWIVGVVGTLLLGIMTPVMAFASTTSQLVSSSPVHTVSIVPTRSVPSVSSPSNASNQSLPTTPGSRLKYKIQSVDHAATQAVGGGNVTSISVDPNNPGTWTAIVNQATGKYKVNVSLATFMVVGTQRI